MTKQELINYLQDNIEGNPEIDLIVADECDNWDAKDISINTYKDTVELVITLPDCFEVCRAN
jgi:hypothetical protein